MYIYKNFVLTNKSSYLCKVILASTLLDTTYSGIFLYSLVYIQHPIGFSRYCSKTICFI